VYLVPACVTVAALLRHGWAGSGWNDKNLLRKEIAVWAPVVLGMSGADSGRGILLP